LVWLMIGMTYDWYELGFVWFMNGMI
jgi:hypothetical protein